MAQDTSPTIGKAVTLLDTELEKMTALMRDGHRAQCALLWLLNGSAAHLHSLAAAIGETKPEDWQRFPNMAEQLLTSARAVVARLEMANKDAPDQKREVRPGRLAS